MTDSSLYMCEICDYETKHKSNYTQHISSIRHKKNAGENVNAKQYDCSYCNYHTIHKSHYNDHILSKSHQMRQEMTCKNIKQNQCKHCMVEFNSRTTLWRHRQKCASQDDNMSVENEFETVCVPVAGSASLNEEKVAEMIQSNIDNKFASIMGKILSNTTTMTTNSHNTINNNNKTFNLNFFLNEHCKNAIDIRDFIDALNYSARSLVENPKLSFTDRISKQLEDGLDRYSVEKRPIHCSDVKRNKMYIRDNGEWLSDKDSRKKMKEIIASIGNKNEDTFRNWVNEHPDCLKLDTPSYDMFMCIYQNILGPTSDEQEELYVNKIINAISEETAIDKEKYSI